MFGQGLDIFGTAFNLPELGISEFFNGGNKTANTGRIGYTATPAAIATAPAWNSAITQAENEKFQNAQNSIKNEPRVFNGTTGTTGNGTDTDQIDTNRYNGYSTTSGSNAPQYTAADERAAYDDQIGALNRLLGYTNTQKQAGLDSLDASMNDEVRKLNEQRIRTMNGYDEQGVQNNKQRQAGYGQVGDYRFPG